MQEFRYLLIRYIPDADRMEPINVGVILQGAGRVDVRVSPHAAKRKEIDTAVFQQWRRFFLDEIRGESAPLFQPPKMSPQFLTYLAQLCEGSVILTRPLVLATDPVRSFDEALESLYRRLVAPPDITSPVAASRPTGRFRQLTENRDFLKRGMKRHVHLEVDKERFWIAYRQVRNGELIAIDKIEVNTQIGATANEIERLPRILQQLPTFLEGAKAGPSRRFVLLADELKQPFTEQAQAEFEAMQEDLEGVVEKVTKEGGRVLRSVRSAEELADEIDRILPPLPAAQHDE